MTTASFMPLSAASKRLQPYGQGVQLIRRTDLVDFMCEFVRSHEAIADEAQWFCEQVRAGIDAANREELIAADEVEAEAAWREQIRRATPERFA